jgi:hypothetical protein
MINAIFPEVAGAFHKAAGHGDVILASTFPSLVSHPTFLIVRILRLIGRPNSITGGAKLAYHPPPSSNSPSHLHTVGISLPGYSTYLGPSLGTLPLLEYARDILQLKLDDEILTFQRCSNRVVFPSGLVHLFCRHG